MAFEHQPGAPIECLSLMIVIEKDKVFNPETNQIVYYSGFSIGGGIDQDYRQSPHNFPDHGIYVTNVMQHAPAFRAGLQFGDKILECNGMDFTMCTHKQANF
ncbi:PDZ domain containing protein 10 [Sarcoptes scabiei]|uniref:PDZ domain containing protein 10 n=1 Tax=Sarcoptes scabiei TaxID=52283 RepID=A0A132AKK3_SARSC|nr:PDZ domain containing protein 10 [Sarcoptes scabiei]